MLMSSSVEIKLHSWPHVYEDIVYTPAVLSKVISASFSNDNCYMVFVSEKAKPEIIFLKDAYDVKKIHTLAALDDVTSVCFQLKTKRIIGCGTCLGQVALYDTQRKTISKLFGNVPSSVKHVDFNVSDQHLAVSCSSGSVVLYDVIDGHCCGNYIISDIVEPTSLKFHPREENILAAASEEGVIMLWDTNTANKTFSAQTHTAAIAGIAYGKIDHDVVVTVGEDNKFCVHDVGIKECVFRSSTQHGLSAVDVSPDGNTIAIGSNEGFIYMYDVRNLLHPITCWKAHSTKVTKLMFTRKTTKKKVLKKAFSEQTKKVVSSQLEISKSNQKIPEPAIRKNSTGVQPEPENMMMSPRIRTDYIDKNNFLKNIKIELMDSLKKDAEELNNHLKEHIVNLESYIENEFIKMDVQMTQKFENLYDERVKKLSDHLPNVNFL
ncbi:protein NEDD1-like [Onthophagus taurus]|uniref:protein NEDD1-like n=1 Tax=Onthophagus taurus TaxID=166361 RepID=UPI0039BEBEE5